MDHGPPADRLKTRLEPILEGDRVKRPRLEHRRAHLRLGPDRSRKAILRLDVKVLVDDGDRLVPDVLEVARRNNEWVRHDRGRARRILVTLGARPPRGADAAPRWRCPPAPRATANRSARQAIFVVLASVTASHSLPRTLSAPIRSIAPMSVCIATTCLVAHRAQYIRLLRLPVLRMSERGSVSEPHQELVCKDLQQFQPTGSAATRKMPGQTRLPRVDLDQHRAAAS